MEMEPMNANYLITLMGGAIQKRVAEEMLRELDVEVTDEARAKVRELVLNEAVRRIANVYSDDPAATTLYKRVGEIAASVVDEPEMQAHFRDAAITAVKNYTAHDLDRWVRQKINEVLTQSIEEIVNERVLAAMKLQRQLSRIKTKKRTRR